MTTATRPKFGRRDSLVRQASVERQAHEGIKRKNTIKQRHELEKSIVGKQLIQRLNDEGVLLLNSLDEGTYVDLSLVINSQKDSRDVLAALLHRFLSVGIQIGHVETRPDHTESDELEILAQVVRCRKSQILDALTKLCIERPVESIFIQKEQKKTDCIWHPVHVSDLDRCAHVVVKYEPTEDPKHPGYGDSVYITRRAELNAIANAYRYGDALPFVEYTKEEHQTWTAAYGKLKELRFTHTCREYQENVRAMEECGLITADRIPQLRDLNKYISQRTGFELRPCGGLLSARDFLASLAFRTFQATLYVRHSSKPNHCPEPDVIHEILGHCPMFADPNMAQMSQEIGLLSLGATDEQIERLSTVYWFIIEFGLTREANGYRAIGAGLISAYGELQHACSDNPDHEDFEPKVAALRTYEDSDYQPLYFVANSISDAMQKLRSYAKEMAKSRRFVYNPITKTVHQLSDRERVKRDVDELDEKLQSLRDELANSRFLRASN
ncbi:Biopterin-dependent aromatic amino acid hydroxylase [Aphelenchoides besseyi]|nr:Biopterin-dependent aromatic amino acid hydroxylase [Aphelenchoides besseyi]